MSCHDYEGVMLVLCSPLQLLPMFYLIFRAKHCFAVLEEMQPILSGV